MGNENCAKKKKHHNLPWNGSHWTSADVAVVATNSLVELGTQGEKYAVEFHILTTLTRDIQCEKFNEDMSVGHEIQWILMSTISSYVYLTNLTKDSKNSETVLCQIWKITNQRIPMAKLMD